ncbi:MAG: DUF2341 domain-containing protein [Myxococcales bacterium]|nr:DUF2341 domain-containing protein [Myxococcales bacterium]
MKRLLFLAALMGCGCSSELEGGAHRVIITVDARLVATCLELQLARADGSALSSLVLPREPARSTYTVGVLRGELPSSITYRAVALIGASCDDRAGLQLNGTSSPVAAAFPASGVVEIALALDAPDATLDADGDGYLDVAKGGSDCDDADPGVHPGLEQACGSTKDTDCNGQVGCADVACAQQAMCQNSATRLTFTNPPRTVAVGACSAELTVEAQGALGAVSVAGDTAVMLGASLSGVTFHIGATCASPAVTQVTLPAGRSSVRAYFKAAQPGAPLLTAAAPPLAPASQSATVVPSAAPQLAFTTPSRSVAAGACSPVVALETRDALGSPLDVSADTTVALAASPAVDFAFYSDDTCQRPVTSVEVSRGSHSANLYFRGTKAGVFDLTASAAGLTDATQQATVTPVPPSLLAFLTAPTAVPAGACSPVVTVQAQDGSGDAAPPGASIDVTLTAAPDAGFTFFSGPSCATAASSVLMAAGTSQVSFSFRGTSVGAVAVTAAAPGLTSATQGYSITPAWYATGGTWAYRKLLTINPARVGAGGVNDFPVLVSCTRPGTAPCAGDADLSGSRVHAQGWDLVFTAADGTTKLSHERESFDNATGKLAAWVKLPSVSPSAPTSFYLYYGNPSVSSDQQDAANVWSNGHVGVWHLNEATGTTVRDSTSNGNDGAKLTAAEPNAVAGHIAGAQDFDGTDDVANLGDDTSLNVSYLTVSLWLRMNAWQPNGGVLAKGGSSTRQYWLWTWGSAVAFEVDEGGMHNGAWTPSLGQWVHLALTYDGTNAVAYQDGVVKNTYAQMTGPIDPRTSPLLLGQLPGFSYADAALDEVRVSSSARTAGWILTEFNSQQSPDTSASGFFSAIGAEEPR